MKIETMLFSLILFLLFVVYSFASNTGNIYISLNVSTVWWNDSVSLGGSANYTDGRPISSSDVAVKLDGTTYCTTQTDSNGLWNCNFRAPLELGTYTLMVNITNTTHSFSNSTTLSVKLNYGETPIGQTERVVYEQPMLIQEPSGKVRIVWARVKIWRGL